MVEGEVENKNIKCAVDVYDFMSKCINVYNEVNLLKYSINESCIYLNAVFVMCLCGFLMYKYMHLFACACVYIVTFSLTIYLFDISIHAVSIYLYLHTL